MKSTRDIGIRPSVSHRPNCRRADRREHSAAFYNAVARQLLGPACELRTEYLTETIPLYYEMSLNADIVHLAVKRRTEHWSGIDFIIIDLTTPSPFALPSHHVIGGVLAFIESQRANALRRYLILLPMMLAGADPAMKAMFPLLDEGMLGVLSDNGDHIGLPETWSYFPKTTTSSPFVTPGRRWLAS